MALTNSVPARTARMLLAGLVAAAFLAGVSAGHAGAQKRRDPDRVGSRPQIARVADDLSEDPGAATVSGTISYTRSFVAPTKECCDAGGPAATETEHENWQISFTGANVPPPPPDGDVLDAQWDTTPATITGTFSDLREAPAGGPGIPSDNVFEEDWEESGSAAIHLLISRTPAGSLAFQIEDASDGHNGTVEGLPGSFTEGNTDPGPNGGSGLASFPTNMEPLLNVTLAAGQPVTETTPVNWPNSNGNNGEPAVQGGTLTANLQLTTAGPAASCDAYWAKPNTTISVPAPGVLGNDSSNGHGALKPRVDHISFGVSSHPYSLKPSGALSFKATKPGKAIITYHDVAADGTTSAPTTATILISARRPKLPCAGTTPPPKKAPPKKTPPTNGKNGSKGKPPTKQSEGACPSNAKREILEKAGHLLGIYGDWPISRVEASGAPIAIDLSTSPGTIEVCDDAVGITGPSVQGAYLNLRLHPEGQPDRTYNYLISELRWPDAPSGQGSDTTALAAGALFNAVKPNFSFSLSAGTVDIELAHANMPAFAVQLVGRAGKTPSLTASVAPELTIALRINSKDFWRFLQNFLQVEPLTAAAQSTATVLGKLASKLIERIPTGSVPGLTHAGLQSIAAAAQTQTIAAADAAGLKVANAIMQADTDQTLGRCGNSCKEILKAIGKGASLTVAGGATAVILKGAADVAIGLLLA